MWLSKTCTQIKHHNTFLVYNRQIYKLLDLHNILKKSCPSDEGTPPMQGHFCSGAKVSSDQRDYCISNIYRKKIWEYKPIISHLMFSSCFFCMLEILKSAPSLTATG